MNMPKPMLAGIYVPLAAKFPVDVQPKLDGLRCLVSADDLVLRSRGGKTYKTACRVRLWCEHQQRAGDR